MDIDWIIFIAGISNLLISFTVWRSNPKAKLNRFFALFGLVTFVQILFDFIFRFFPTLFVLKCSYALAALIPLTASLWIFEICNFHIKNKFLKFIYFLPGLAFFIIAFVDDLIVKQITGLSILGYQGVLGVLFPAYTFYFATYVIFFVILLYRNQRLSEKSSDFLRRNQLNYILCGILLYSGFSLVYSLILPSFLNIYDFTLLDAPSLIFFVGFTGYAITKHHLFDVKVIATELLTFAIWLILLIKTFLSVTFQDFLFNGTILGLVVIFGVFLIRSVMKEVKQKEKMEKLAGDLEKAYGAEKLAKEKVDAARVEDEALLTSIGDGVVAIDKEGKIMFINRVAQDLLAIKNADVIDKPYEQILAIENEKGEPVAKENNPLHQALTLGKKTVTDATGGTLNVVYYFVRPDKTKFPAAVTVAPVILDGKIIGAVDVFRDVTVERQIDKSKSEFVSLASHQLRTPLTAIKWYTEILQKEQVSAKVKKCLKEIYKGNERMIKLIDIMLNISRFEAGRIKINFAPANIKKILEDIIKEQKFEINRRKEKFVFECPNDLPEILIDQNLFRLVFQNLISNAIKYTQNRGQVSCKVEKKGNIFSFEVADTGIGIPENQKKRIFEKLFRADNAYTHEPEGNGLGLYAAKMTIEGLGGKIWFKSKEGEGTTFFVELPIKPATK